MIRRAANGLVGVGLAAVLVSAGCAGGDSGSAGDTSPASATTVGDFDDPFLAEVAATDRPVDEALRTFIERLNTQYTNREGYFEALEGLDLRENFETVLDNARALAPPSEYEEPYRIWFDNLQDYVQLAEEFETGVEAGDVAAAAIPAARLNSEFEGVLIELTALSPDFCRAVTAGTPSSADDDGDPFTARACVVAEGLPGGDYGRQANLLVRETAATVFPLISTAPLGLMHDDEEVRYLAEIQPTVEAEFERARQELSDLTPPSELQGDHEAVLTYLRDIADIARRITEAAEANDQSALQPLYDESGRPASTLTQALSEDGTEIFRPFVLGDE